LQREMTRDSQGFCGQGCGNFLAQPRSRARRVLAHVLNAEGVTSPQPQKGRLSRSWCVSSVRHVLLNRKYSGTRFGTPGRKFVCPELANACSAPAPSRSG
jgi:hypothetical protein